MIAYTTEMAERKPLCGGKVAIMAALLLATPSVVETLITSIMTMVPNANLQGIGSEIGTGKEKKIKTTITRATRTEVAEMIEDMTTMTSTKAVIMTGTAIMAVIERGVINVDPLLLQGINLGADLDRTPALHLIQKASGQVVLTWGQLLQLFCLVQLFQAMLGFVSRCTIQRRELYRINDRRRNTCKCWILFTFNRQQLPFGASQAVYGAVQNMLPFNMGQLGTLPLIPAQAMTQQGIVLIPQKAQIRNDPFLAGRVGMATRHARRVYVGGLPPGANEQTIATFFSQVMAAIGGNSAGPGDSVVNVYINHEKKFAFVEMRTVEEASNAMALDGIIFEGVAVRVRRPTDYNPALAAALGPSQPNPHLNLTVIGLTPGVIGGAEGPDRIFVGGLPYHFTETQIRDLLQSFGPLRGLDIVKDKDTGNSKGYGFCIYQDPTVTDVACAALNGLKMGDKTLTMRRATASGQSQSEQENILAHVQQHIAIQKMALQAGGVNISGLGIGSLANETPTKVLCLTELITPGQLKDDEEYGEILEDMQDECSKFGILVNVVIPRPNDEAEEDIPGIGKVFLEYADTTGCANARNALSGRKFEGNSVKAVYYPEDKYYSRDYSA